MCKHLENSNLFKIPPTKIFISENFKAESKFLLGMFYFMIKSLNSLKYGNYKLNIRQI